MNKITAILQLLLTRHLKGRFFFREACVPMQETLVIISVLAGFFLAGCNLFGKAPASKPTSRRQPVKQQVPENVSNKQAEELLQQLDKKFARLDALRVQMEDSRIKEETALAREYEELRKLRNEMQLWIKARKAAVTQPDNSNTRREYSGSSGRYQEEPDAGGNISRWNDFKDNPKDADLQPLRIDREPVLLAEPPLKVGSIAPPPFLDSERKSYPQKPKPGEKALPLLPNDGGISPPPFATSVKPLVKAPVKTAPPEPIYFTPPANTTAKPEGSLQVIEISDAPLGRILNVEGKGKDRRILLDIGSSDSLHVGSLVSVGGVGPEYGIWQVDSVEKYASRARHLPESANRTPSTGTYVHVVRIDVSK